MGRFHEVSLAMYYQRVLEAGSLTGFARSRRQNQLLVAGKPSEIGFVLDRIWVPISRNVVSIGRSGGSVSEKNRYLVPVVPHKAVAEVSK